MSPKQNKWCVVPLCSNTTIKTPEKLFIYVPRVGSIRRKWLEAARRDPKSLSPKSSIFFCEDHFDLENDMENYLEYCVMGLVSKVRMKPGVLPKKFDCQPDRKKLGGCDPFINKKLRKMAIAECLSEVKELETSEHILEEERQLIDDTTKSKQGFAPVETSGFVREDNLEVPKTADKAIQISCEMRSCGVQKWSPSTGKAVSPTKPSCHSIATSLLKRRHSPSKMQCCLTKGAKVGRNVFTIAEDRDISDELSCVRKKLKSNSDSDSSLSSTLSINSMQAKSSSDKSELMENDWIRLAEETLKLTIKKIKDQPRLYIGIPKMSYFIVDLIVKEIKIPEHHLLLCLKKIRLDTETAELAIDFGMTESYANKIFLRSVPLIASVLRSLIVTPDSQLIKQTLPIPFRRKYSNISCIIDCLEIEIQKPSKEIHQELTWSDYKKANTVKYLVSYTPNGLVSYISPGYGGRVAEICLVETCKFVTSVKRGMCIMADGSFKHVEQYLRKNGVTLVHLPNVAAGTKLTKKEAIKTKQTASLRIHAERVVILYVTAT